MDNDVVAFIDCNPAFTAYTKVGLCAATKLVVPLNADDFSAGAVKMMLRKLYNRFPVSKEHPFREDMVEESFAAKAFKYANQDRMSLPQFRLIIHNRENSIAKARGHKTLQIMRKTINESLHNEICQQIDEEAAIQIGRPISVSPSV